MALMIMEFSLFEKDEIRRRIWSLMEEMGVSRFPKPVFGRIPNFVGAEEAAQKLVKQEEFQRAEVVKVNPDAPQNKVRAEVLSAGKLLLMPTPRLRRGFMLLDPNKISDKSYMRVSSIKGAFKHGKLCPLEELPNVDLIVAGSVAVSKDGIRVGKGGGYGEMEYGVLREIGAVGEETPIFTTVHDVQVVDKVPKEPHDFTVDAIITPTKTVRVKRRYKQPDGIYWERITEEQLRDMSILSELKKKKLQKQNLFSL